MSTGSKVHISDGYNPEMMHRLARTQLWCLDDS